MERKIGEIFEYNGEWYQCVEGNCAYCSIQDEACGQRIMNDVCRLNRIFKKLEKVGEPYTTFVDKTVQNYLLETAVSVPPKDVFTLINNEQRLIAIEIKQNKEDMSNTETLWYGPDKKEAKSLKLSNLKPFSLEAAKAGKPVCTRDGRKARIICFDAEGNKPLIVLSKINGQEVILRYTKKGQSDNFHSPTPREDDLMMLPKKKEGWVNVYKDSVYGTKDEALIVRSESRGYIDTIKINWEE